MAKITKTTAIKEIVVQEKVDVYHLELSQEQMDYLYTVMYNVIAIESRYTRAEDDLWMSLCKALPDGSDTRKLSEISFEAGKMRVRDAR